MIIALFAVDKNGGIGFDNSLPWPRNKEDMSWFKATTENQIVVMGRKTWDSKDMPIPLPKRHNVLITNTFIARSDITQIKGDIPSGLIKLQNDYPDNNIFVIGGADILMQAKPALERAYITKMNGEYVSDIFIDVDQFLKGFKLINVNKLSTCEIEEYATIQTGS